MPNDLKNSKNYVFSEKDARDGMVIISKYLPKNSLYLHSAIISIENGIPYIYDNDPDNPINKQGGSVRRITLKDYLKVNKVIEYYDTKLTSEQIKERVKKYLHLKFSWLSFNCEIFIEKVTQMKIKRSSFHPIQKLAIGLMVGTLILAKKGGKLSKTPAPKSERIYGSELNKPKSAESSSKASSIVLGESTINSIKSILDKHNDAHTKKIPLSVGKAVVRRGMGAYSSTHRPTISEGKPNSRVAWGLARLNAFVYKIQKGHSKSGKYIQDDDLIKELGIMVKKYSIGGSIENNYHYTIGGL